jgi:hypothetical protein
MNSLPVGFFRNVQPAVGCLHPTSAVRSAVGVDCHFFFFLVIACWQIPLPFSLLLLRLNCSAISPRVLLQSDCTAGVVFNSAGCSLCHHFTTGLQVLRWVSRQTGLLEFRERTQDKCSDVPCYGLLLEWLAAASNQVFGLRHCHSGC